MRLSKHIFKCTGIFFYPGIIDVFVLLRQLCPWCCNGLQHIMEFGFGDVEGLLVGYQDVPMSVNMQQTQESDESMAHESYAATSGSRIKKYQLLSLESTCQLCEKGKIILRGGFSVIFIGNEFSNLNFMGCTQLRAHNIVFVEPGDYISYLFFKGKLKSSVLFPYNIRNNIFLQPEPREHVLKLVVLAERGSDKLLMPLQCSLFQPVEHVTCSILVKQSSFMHDDVVTTRLGNMNSIMLHFNAGVGGRGNGNGFNLVYLETAFLRDAFRIRVIDEYIHLLRSDDHTR